MRSSSGARPDAKSPPAQPSRSAIGVELTWPGSFAKLAHFVVKARGEAILSLRPRGRDCESAVSRPSCTACKCTEPLYVLRMRYLVKARVKAGRERSLLKAIQDGTLGQGSI